MNYHLLTTNYRPSNEVMHDKFNADLIHGNLTFKNRASYI